MTPATPPEPAPLEPDRPVLEPGVPLAMPVAEPDALDADDAGARAARGGAIRAVGFGIVTLLGLISAPLLIRHLGIVDFGRYVTVLSLVTVIAGFSEAGMAVILQREYASRPPDERGQVLRDLLGIRLVLTAAGAIIGTSFAWVAGYESALVVGTAISSVGLMFQSTQTFLSGALAAELRFGWLTAAEVVRQVLFVSSTLLLIALGAELTPFFLAQLPAFGLTLVLTIYLVRRIVPLRPSFHPKRWWPLLKDTAAFAIAVALNAAYFRVAVIALSVLASETQTGNFATAFRVIEMLVGVPGLIIGAAFPILTRAARDDRARLEYASSRLLEIALIMGTGTALFIGVGAEPIIRLVAGSEGLDSVPLLHFQAVALGGTFVAVASSFVLLALRKQREVLLANLAALIASIVCALTLIPAYEAKGAAIAVLVAELTLATISLVVLLRAYPRAIVAVRRAPLVLLAAAVSLLVLFVPGLPATVQTVVAVVVFPLALLALGRFPPEVTEMAVGILQRRRASDA